MGTRHAQYVINREGEEKVAQYLGAVLLTN